MADISKINVNSTTYNLKDSRLPDLNSSTSQYLRGDGTWADPTVNTISSAADVTDNETYMTIEPSSLTPTVTVNLQTKTGITPSTSSQTITADNGYDGLSSVQINAMPTGSATTPTTTITATPTISVNSSGLITASVSGSQSITPTVSAGYVSSGTAGMVSVSGSNTSQLTAKAAATYTPTTSAQTIASGQYLTGMQTISGDANLVAANIASGVSIFGVAGAHYGYTLLGSKSMTANTTSTSATSLDNVTVSSAWTTAKIIYVRIRDEAGARAGYFYGSDNWFINYNAANESTSAITNAARLITRYSTSSQWALYAASATAGYGVYAYDISSAGRVRIYTRYSSSYSLSISGTYLVEVYGLDWPDGVGIYS